MIVHLNDKISLDAFIRGTHSADGRWYWYIDAVSLKGQLPLLDGSKTLVRFETYQEASHCLKMLVRDFVQERQNEFQEECSRQG